MTSAATEIRRRHCLLSSTTPVFHPHRTFIVLSRHSPRSPSSHSLPIADHNLIVLRYRPSDSSPSSHHHPTVYRLVTVIHRALVTCHLIAIIHHHLRAAHSCTQFQVDAIHRLTSPCLGSRSSLQGLRRPLIRRVQVSLHIKPRSRVHCTAHVLPLLRLSPH